MYLSTFAASGRQQGRVTASGGVGGDARLVGVTAYAPIRGIVTFRSGGDLFYFNRNSGNYDDLASATDDIADAEHGARANFMAFTAPYGVDFRGDGNGAVHDVWFKSLPP